MKLSNHIVICGWGRKAFHIVRELHAPVLGDTRAVLLVHDEVGPLPEEERFANVEVLSGDPTRDETLREAGIEQAASAVILADVRRGDLADARSILIALAIESINRAVHTAVEVLDSANLPHFSRTAVNEIVSVSDLSEKLLAQAALNHGVTDFYQELMLFQEDGNEFYRVPLPEQLIGRTFADVHAALLPERIIAVGLHRDGAARINPAADVVTRQDDDVWVIAYQRPTLT